MGVAVVTMVRMIYWMGFITWHFFSFSVWMTFSGICNLLRRKGGPGSFTDRRSRPGTQVFAGGVNSCLKEIEVMGEMVGNLIRIVNYQFALLCILSGTYPCPNDFASCEVVKRKGLQKSIPGSWGHQFSFRSDQ